MFKNLLRLKLFIALMTFLWLYSLNAIAQREPVHYNPFADKKRERPFPNPNGNLKALTFIQTSSRDSLALVSFYNSTNGLNWTNKTNWLTGQVASWFGVEISNGRVIGLRLQNNNLTGALPTDIGNLDQLIYLQLSSDNIGGTIPASLYTLTNLQELWLMNNPLTGTISESIGSLTKLKTLYFANNKLTGPIPANIDKLTNLTEVSFGQNNFTGDMTTIINKLSLAKNLNRIDIYSTSIIGVLPPSIGTLTNLWDLFLDRNKLTGSLPPEIGYLINLTNLALSNNKFSGNLPELANLTKLQYFWSDNNLLTGGIPNSYNNLKSLIIFNHGWNKLSGSVPEFIGYWPNLRQLYLYENSFTGPLPTSLVNLVNLNTLWVHKNNLSGIFPAIAPNFNYCNFQLHNNQFTSIPNFSSSPYKATLTVYADNNKLDFGTLEPNFSSPGVPAIGTFRYAPQDSVNIAANYNTLKISVITLGANNTYQWQKNGVSIPGATQSSISISKTDTLPAYYNCLISNSKVPNLTLSSKKLKTFPYIPPTGKTDGLGFTKIISQEINTVNGTALIKVRLYADTNLTWLKPVTISKPANWTLGTITYPTKTTLVKRDSVDFSFVLTYPTSNLPFFPKDISFSFNVILGTKTENQLAKGKLYFTPYNTLEVWGESNFFSLNRIWIQPGSIKDTARRAIAKSAIPVSNILPTDIITEDWQDDFQWKMVPGLAYMVKMRGVNPSTITQENIDDGPDSSYSPPGGGNSAQRICIFCNAFTRTFTGTVRGRLVSNIINDRKNLITIPLSGVLVKLKDLDLVFNEEFGEATTDINGYFTINYSVKQSPLEGREVELFLKIKTINREYNIKVKDEGIFGPIDGTYERAWGLGSWGETANINTGNITLSDGHWNVLNWAYKSFYYFEGQGLPLYRELAILPYRSGSNFQEDGQGFSLPILRPTIRLQEGDTRHENTVYHEFGHFAMWSLQSKFYIPTSFVTTHSYDKEANTVRLAWSEGWADGMRMILDAVYRDENGNGTFDVDEEYGIDQIGRGFEVRGTYASINNGILSEYYMGCAIYDLWDGPGKGLPETLPTFGGTPATRHGYNDLDNTGKPYTNGWAMADNIELTFNQIVKPLTVLNTPGVQTKVLISNVSDYVRRLLDQISDCNLRNQIGNCFNQNRVVLDINSYQNLKKNTGINTDGLVYSYEEEAPFLTTKYYINPYFGLKGQNNFSFGLPNGATLNDDLPLIGTSAATNKLSIVPANGGVIGTCGTVTINVQNATLSIGNSPTVFRTEIRRGSVLQVQSGGVLTIADNTTLVIDCGATLIFENGGNIIFGGSNSKLIIDGTLQLVGVSSLPVAYSKSTLSISGPISAEKVGSTYTISGKTGDTFAWSVPSGWKINGQSVTSLVAGTSVTISPPSGTFCNAPFITISANPLNGCYAGAASLSIRPAGGGYSSSDYPVSGPDNASCNSFVSYSTVDLPGATNYMWIFPSGATNVSGQGSRSISFTLPPSGSGSIQVGVRVANACDAGGSPAFKFTNVSCPFRIGFAVYPNPAGSQLNIERTNTSIEEVSMASKQSNNDQMAFEVKLFDKFQQVVKTGTSNHENIQLNVSGLADGMYYLHIMQNGQVVERQHIIIQK